MEWLWTVLTLWVLGKLLQANRIQEETLREQWETNEHLRAIRRQAAWARIRNRFLAEHGMTIEEYGSRYGLPLEWLQAWLREVNAAMR